MERTLASLMDEIRARHGDVTVTTVTQALAELHVLDRRDALRHRLRVTRGTNGRPRPPSLARPLRMVPRPVPQGATARTLRAASDATEEVDVPADVDASPPMPF